MTMFLGTSVGSVGHALAGLFQALLPVRPDHIQLRCYVTDPDNGQVISTLVAGNTARVPAAVKAGETVMASKAMTTGTASVSVSRSDLKVRLGHMVLDIPPVDQRDELLELYASEPSTWPAACGQRFIDDFIVPNKWPRSQVIVKLVAKIDGVGSRACSKTLEGL
jgi:hypothetical protein